jgi:hypothetical protein
LNSIQLGAPRTACGNAAQRHRQTYAQILSVIFVKVQREIQKPEEIPQNEATYRNRQLNHGKSEAKEKSRTYEVLSGALSSV